MTLSNPDSTDSAKEQQEGASSTSVIGDYQCHQA
jgi:hypothetical protein